MKIVLLTSVYSGVAEQIAGITESNDFAIVDFSDNYRLSRFCEKKHIRHIPFISWEHLVAAPINKFDLLISYKINKIISMDFVNRFTFGGINIHPSMLPKYPGLNPWFQMYCDMELNSGVTIHRINRNPDSGNIIAQHTFHIELGQPLPIAMKIADDTAARLISKVITDQLFLNPGFRQQLADNHSTNPVQLESLKKLPVARLWHILRGFPSLIPILYPELPHKFFEVGEYSPQLCDETKGGTTYLDGSERKIICLDGIIQLWDFSRIPTTQDYLDAVSNSDFIDPCLNNMTFLEKDDGSLSFMQGYEAIIFKAKSSRDCHAVRFPRNITSDKTEYYVKRLQTVRRHLNRLRVAHFPKYKVVPEAIKLSKGIFPAVVMKWYEGKTLMEYLRQNLYHADKLTSLLHQFKVICHLNHEANIIHGDIHSDNIIIDKHDNITILDIDGMWTPSLGVMRDRGGNRNWQHPLRVHNKYVTNGLDNFSEIIVCATIFTAIIAPDIFERYAQDDFMFSESDYLSSDQSPLISEIICYPKSEQVGNLIFDLCRVTSIDQIPTVESIKNLRI